MFRQFSSSRLYALLIILALGVFVWAGLTGTWLTGDDLERVEKRDGRPGQGFHRSGSHYRGGRSIFYHK